MRVRKVSYPPVLTVPTISLSGIITAAAATTVTVTATVANAGSSYLIHWMNHGIEFTTTTVPSVTYTKTAGIDTITARVVSTATYGCYDSTTSAGHIVSLPLGIAAAYMEQGLHVYPNPVNDIIHVDAITGPISYRLMNMVGQVLMEGALNSGSNSIDVKALPKGVYMMEVRGAERGERRLINKVLKQ